MKTLSYTTLLPLCLALGASANAHDCVCRAKNIAVVEGQSACLETPAGWRLARCGKVLNNSAWVFLPIACSAKAPT